MKELQKSLSVSSKSDPSPYRGVICRRAVPVKPFTARSLVGMTMGARKRRARGLVGDLGHMLYGDYRIGQRLRPCPGCSLCKGVGCYACYPKFDQDCDACVNGMSFLCDGSGVLPAKRSAQ